jgi:hypothetical protein
LIRPDGSAFRDRGGNRQTLPNYYAFASDANLRKKWLDLREILTDCAVGGIVDNGCNANTVDILRIMRVATVVIADTVRFATTQYRRLTKMPQSGHEMQTLAHYRQKGENGR